MNWLKMFDFEWQETNLCFWCKNGTIIKSYNKEANI